MKNSGAFTMGIVLLLTVLLVLMLTTFSLLTLSNARSDLAQAQALGQRTREYYAANNQAEEILARLAAGENPGHPLTRENGCIAYAVPLGEAQQLTVLLREEDLAILSWNVE